MVADEFSHLLGRLPHDDLRQVAVLRLENYSPGEIAERLGVSERTVWRKLGLIRRYWEAVGTAVSPETDSVSDREEHPLNN
jgi:DNA-directed RNA polymerase specialized sigma24 family protein